MAFALCRYVLRLADTEQLRRMSGSDSKQASRTDAKALFRPGPGTRTLATAAYSFCLTHKVVPLAVRMSSLQWPAGLQHLALAGALIAAVVTATVLYWSVERPFLKLPDRVAVAAPLR